MQKAKQLFRSKVFWTIVFLIFIIRAAAPPLILRQLNAFLGSFSPLYAGHINDINLGVFRGAYQVVGLDLRLKNEKGAPQENPFFQAQLIDISIAWRDLLKGQLTADVDVDGARAILSDHVIDAFKKASAQAKADSKKARDKLIPLRLERIDIRDSTFQLAEVASIPESSRFRLSKIQGRLSNITANAQTPLSLMTVQASLFDAAPIKVVATLNTLQEPMAWDMDAELRDFPLSQANPWLKRKLPLTFTSGKLDAYSEMRSENGRIEGYVKPFVHKADVVANNESFKGLKHFGIEVTTAAVNLILRDAKDKTMATKVLFAYDNGKFELNKAEAISKAIKNGFSDKIPEGLDNEISLSEKSKNAETTKTKP